MRRFARPRFALIVAVLGLVVLAACAPGANALVDTAGPEGTIAGFWRGLWHGMIVPITFLVSLFTDSVTLYEVHNNGGWYDFGFVLGLMMCLGGGASGGRKVCTTPEAVAERDTQA